MRSRQSGQPTNGTSNRQQLQCYTARTGASSDTQGKATQLPGVCRLVMQQLAQRENWRIGDWVYDGRKSIYSPNRYLPQRSEYEVCASAEPPVRATADQKCSFFLAAFSASTPCLSLAGMENKFHFHKMRNIVPTLVRIVESL